MPTLEELHEAYMNSVEYEHEAQQLNEYCCTEDDIVELEEIHWHPVARDIDYENHIAKLKAMKEFNSR